MNVVVTGASRGIGLELTRLGLENDGRVLAVARKPEESKGLQDLSKKFPGQLQLVSADLLKDGAAHSVAAQLEDWPHVDILFNNAGILRQGTAVDDFMQSFLVNSVSPFLMTQALLPWLKKSRAPRVVNITSLMGSVQDNASGGYYAYRSSKAALNMINKSLSQDHDWLTTIVMHPGWVKTDMGGAGAPTEARESAMGIWKVTAGVTRDASGRFFDFRGKELPW